VQNGEYINRTYGCLYRASDSTSDQWYDDDLGPAVTAINFAAQAGQLPAAKLDLVYGEYLDASDAMSVDIGKVKPLQLRRNDLIAITETTDAEPTPTRRVLFVGKIADFGIGTSATTHTASLTLQSMLSSLESNTTLDLISSRVGLGLKDVLLFDKFHTLQDRVMEAYPPLIKDSERVVNQGISSLFDDTLLATTISGVDGRCMVRPFALVRDILLYCIIKNTDAFMAANRALLTLAEQSDIMSRVTEIDNRLFSIKDDQVFVEMGTVLEYPAFVNYVISSCLRFSADSPSIWDLVMSICNSFYVQFVPNLSTDIKDIADYYPGSVQPMSAYTAAVAELREANIEYVNGGVVDHNLLVRGVSHIFRPSVLPFTAVESAFEDAMRLKLFIPLEKEWLLGASGRRSIKYRLPETGKIMSVPVPPWFESALISSKQDSDGRAVAGKLPNTDTSTTESVKKALPSSVLNYMASAWMYHGRLACRASVGLMMFYSGIEPGDVIKFDARGSKFTAVLKSISLSWVQGRAYTVTAELTHVTQLNDPYYRALNIGLHVPTKDNIYAWFKEPK